MNKKLHSPNSGDDKQKIKMLRVAFNHKKNIVIHHQEAHSCWLGDPFEDDILDSETIKNSTPNKSEYCS